MRIRLGTRGSRLALAQARAVEAMLIASVPSTRVEIVVDVAVAATAEIEIPVVEELPRDAGLEIVVDVQPFVRPPVAVAAEGPEAPEDFPRIGLPNLGIAFGLIPVGPRA